MNSESKLNSQNKNSPQDTPLSKLVSNLKVSLSLNNIRPIQQIKKQVKHLFGLIIQSFQNCTLANFLKSGTSRIIPLNLI